MGELHGQMGELYEEVFWKVWEVLTNACFAYFKFSLYPNYQNYCFINED